MTTSTAVFMLLFLFCSKSWAAVFSECDLAKILKHNGIDEKLLPDWICLAKSESAFNSTAVGGPNKNGSFDNGIFQINDTWWCDYGKPGKDCNVDCNDLLSDDITASIECAKKIFNRHKFSAWHGWTKRCKGKRLPDLSKCDL